MYYRKNPNLFIIPMSSDKQYKKYKYTFFLKYLYIVRWPHIFLGISPES